MNEELNRKLAEWAGFRETRLSSGHLGWLYPPEYSLEKGYLPNFTDSLDACFKWLVPAWNTKARPIPSWIENITFCLMSGDLIRCDLQQFDNDYDTWADADTPALALCKAIEKLIDETAN